MALSVRTAHPRATSISYAPGGSQRGVSLSPCLMLAIRLASASTSTSSSRTSPSSVVVMVLAPQKSGDGLRRHAERVGELLHVVKHHSLAASLDVRYTDRKSVV